MLLVLEDIVINTEEVLMVKPQYKVIVNPPNKFGWYNGMENDPIRPKEKVDMRGSIISFKNGDFAETKTDFEPLCKMINNLQSNS